MRPWSASWKVSRILNGVLTVLILVAVSAMVSCSGGGGGGNGTGGGGTTPALDFSFSGTIPGSVVAGGTGTAAISVVRTGGHSGAITLIVQSNAYGVTGTGTVAAGASSGNLSIVVPTGVAAGSYSLAVNGTDGTLSRVATVGLTVAGAASPDFSLSVGASSPVNAGETGAIAVTVARINGHSRGVTLGVATNPQGITGTGTVAAGGTTGTLFVAIPAGVAAGDYTLTVTGNDGTLAHTATLSVTVRVPGAPDYALTATNPSAIQAGAIASVPISLSRVNAHAKAVTVTAEQNAQGVAGTVTLGAADATGTLNLAVPAGVAVGSYTLTLRGTDGTVEHAATVTVTVVSLVSKDFTLGVSQPASIVAGQSGSTAVALTRINGHSAAVTLTVGTNAQGITGSGSVASGAATGALALTVPSGVAAGSYALTVTASDGTLSRTATVSVTVTTAATADFTFVVANPAAIQAGSAGNATATVTRTNGHNKAVTLTVGTNAQGITGSGSVASGAATGALALTVPSGVAAGSYALTVTASDGTLSRTATVSVPVTTAATADFTFVVANPAAIQAGSAGNATATVTRTNGHNKAVTLTVGTNAQGITGSGSVASGAATGTLALTVPSGVAAGSYALTVTASDGTLSRTATVSVTVTTAATYSFSVGLAGTIPAGVGGDATVTVTRNAGHTAAIAVAVTANPQGITGNCSVAQGAGSATLHLQVPAGLAPGSYALAITATDGGSSKTANLTVTTTAAPVGFPIITIQPVGIPAAQRSDYTLMVGVTGAKPFSFVWYRNGEVVPHAVGPILRLEPKDAGEFMVVVTNGHGSVASNKVVFESREAAPDEKPVILTQPEDMVVRHGMIPSMPFLAKAAGGVLKYQRSEDGGSNWADIPFNRSAPFYAEMNFGFYPADVAKDDGRYFRGVLTNANGSVATKAVKMTVKPVTYIPSQAPELPVVVCKVGEVGNIYYKDDATALNERTGYSSGGSVSPITWGWSVSRDGNTWVSPGSEGVTISAEGTISGHLLSHNGLLVRKYGTNEAGGIVNCMPVTLSVVDVNKAGAPVITGGITITNPEDRRPGGVLAMSVAATGTAPITFQWKKSLDGRTWANVASGSGGNCLSDPLDGGLQAVTWYKVVATNGAGSSEAMYSVPSFYSLLDRFSGSADGYHPVEGCQGQAVNVASYEYLTPETLAHGILESSDGGRTWHEYTSSNGFAFLSLSSSQNGQLYRLYAKNPLGTTLGNIFTVNARDCSQRDAIRWVGPNTSGVIGQIGEAATISVKAFSEMSITYRWNWRSADGSRWVALGDTADGSRTMTLSAADDGAWIYVEATNGMNQTSEIRIPIRIGGSKMVMVKPNVGSGYVYDQRNGGWVAVRDGDGPWTKVPVANHVVTFNVADSAGRYSVAWIESDAYGKSVRVYHRALSDGRIVDPDTTFYSWVAKERSVDGTVKGLQTDTSATVASGFSTQGGVGVNGGTFSLKGNTYVKDLLAVMKSSWNYGWSSSPLKMIIRRDFMPGSTFSKSVDLDFSTGEAVAFEKAKITLTGNENSAYNTVSSQGFVSGFDTIPTGGTFVGADSEIGIVPSSKRLSGDYHYYTATNSSQSGNQIQSLTLMVKSGGDRALRFPANFLATTTFALSGQSIQGAWTAPTGYNTFDLSANGWKITMTRAWNGGGGNFSYLSPNLTTLPMWPASLTPTKGWGWGLTGSKIDAASDYFDGTVINTVSGGGTIP